MRVLILTSNLDPGGVAHYIREIISPLMEAGHIVQVAAHDLSNTNDGVLGQFPNLSVRECSRGRQVRLLAQTTGVDVVLLNKGTDPPDTRNATRLLMAGIPVVEILHAYRDTQARRSPAGWWRQMAYRFRRDSHYRLVVLNRQMRRAALEHYPPLRSKISFLRPCVDVEHLIHQPRLNHWGGAGGDQNGAFECLHLGRLTSDQKLPALAIETIALVRRMKPRLNTRLHMVGEGPLRGHLVQLAKQLGVDDIVQFHGWCNDPSNHLRLSHVLLFPTRGEGFGRVAIEAAASGLPVLASDVSGCRDSVSRVAGKLIPAHSVDAWAQSVIELAEDSAKWRKMSSSGPAWAGKFTVSRHVSRLVTTLEQAIRGR